MPSKEVADTSDRYRRAWDKFVDHGADMQRLAATIEHDLEAAADFWNATCQPEVDDAYSTVICEREPWPKVNLQTLALRHYRLQSVPPLEAVVRDRKLKPRDNEAAWRKSPGGVCRGCGTPTISQAQHDRMRRLLNDHKDVFDVQPTYQQTNGRPAPLWSNRILIAAKGVADHLLPWAHGGASDPDNLANVCAGCNYSRGDTSLDVVRVAAYI